MNMWQVTAREQASEGWSALFWTHLGCIQMQTPPHFFVEKRKLKRGVVRGQTLGFFPRTWDIGAKRDSGWWGCWRNWRRREGGERRWNFALANYSITSTCPSAIAVTNQRFFHFIFYPKQDELERPPCLETPHRDLPLTGCRCSWVDKLRSKNITWKVRKQDPCGYMVVLQNTFCGALFSLLCYASSVYWITNFPPDRLSFGNKHTCKVQTTNFTIFLIVCVEKPTQLNSKHTNTILRRKWSSHQFKPILLQTAEQPQLKSFSFVTLVLVVVT